MSSDPRFVDFVNADVERARNPSAFGLHHGPLVNPNPGFDPHAGDGDAATPGTGNNVSPAMNASAPNPGVQVSALNSGVCFVQVDAAGTMCGRTFAQQANLRRHMRNAHPGATANVNRGNHHDGEIVAGRNVLKKYVRDLHWRNARFLNEPHRGAIGGEIDQFATEMEQLASQHAAFRHHYGSRFHRAPDARDRNIRWRSQVSRLAASSDAPGICHDHASHVSAPSPDVPPVQPTTDESPAPTATTHATHVPEPAPSEPTPLSSELLAPPAPNHDDAHASHMHEHHSPPAKRRKSSRVRRSTAKTVDAYASK